MTAMSQSYVMTRRHVRFLLRQPWFVATTIIQPVIWLVLFGALFERVVTIPGFVWPGDYLDYLVPGVVVMTALFSSGWSGMGIIEDLDRGIMDRFLAAPIHRSSLIIGRTAYEAISLIVQAVIIGVLAWALGARFAGGLVGFSVLVLAALLVAAAFGSLSDAFALVLRQRESVIGINVLLVLPLTFLSATFIPLHLAPDWIATIARFNPVNWAVEAGREALLLTPDWSFILPRLVALTVVAVAMVVLATRTFQSYQRSI